MIRVLAGVAAAAGAALVGAVSLFTPTQEPAAAATTQPVNVCGTPTTGTATTTAAVARTVRTVIAAGRALGVPDQGIRVGIGVTLVESGGLNLASAKVPESVKYPNDGVAPGDHLSINAFQQQVGLGWFDTVAHGMDPTVAARSFFTHLLAVPGWQQLGFGGAAQAVQRSAFPARYAAREADAAALLAKYAGATCTAPVVASGGWVNPLTPARYTIGSPFGWRTMWGGPNFHKGQDLMVPTGTVDHAPCTGVVTYAPVMDPFGGGKEVDIDCGGGVVVKLMHHSRTDVTVGQHVAAGFPVALTGSTGHSTGPHLHVQVDVGGVPVPPVPFLAGRGVRL